MKKFISALGSFVLIFFISKPSFAQKKQDFSGQYKYEIRHTPSGDYFGTLTLKKVEEKYSGEIVNLKGRKFTVNFLRLKDNRLIFSSNIEDTNNSIVTCSFLGDSIKATIEVPGDDFLYKLYGKKISTGHTE